MTTDFELKRRHVSVFSPDGVDPNPDLTSGEKQGEKVALTLDPFQDETENRFW
jgi:hypothetical protein